MCTGDRALSFGTDTARFFSEQVSPFVGLYDNTQEFFDELFTLLPDQRGILHATPDDLTEPKGWQLISKTRGLQFVYKGESSSTQSLQKPVPLEQKDVEQMMALAEQTKPGPFGPDTIAFGHYFGVFENDRLVAMAGQRLHAGDYTEISAVCTHPGHLGKGYAALLIQHLVQLILEQGKRPFLHVREDNSRAVALYQRLNFSAQRNMNFYFLKRKPSR